MNFTLVEVRYHLKALLKDGKTFEDLILTYTYIRAVLPLKYGNKIDLKQLFGCKNNTFS